jgi:hypothetical protein
VKIDKTEMYVGRGMSVSVQHSGEEEIAIITNVGSKQLITCSVFEEGIMLTTPCKLFVMCGVRETEQRHRGFWRGDLRERDHLKDLDVDGWIN